MPGVAMSHTGSSILPGVYGCPLGVGGEIAPVVVGKLVTPVGPPVPRAVGSRIGLSVILPVWLGTMVSVLGLREYSFSAMLFATPYFHTSFSLLLSRRAIFDLDNYLVRNWFIIIVLGGYLLYLGAHAWFDGKLKVADLVGFVRRWFGLLDT